MSQPFVKPLVDSAKIWINDFRQLYHFLSDLISTYAAAGWDRAVSVYNMYNYLDSFSDPKLRQFPLMGGPFLPLLVLCCYFSLVSYGQTYVNTPTRGKKSHDLVHRPIFGYTLVLYNLSMALLNAWISFELIYCGFKRKYNFLCQLVYPGTDDPYENRIAEAIWWYFASKGFELLDTLFIILKKKSSQLSFLHIYHHSSMFAVWWVGAKYVPGGSTLTAALVNCLVHVIMYGYYAASALGPKARPYLWWKKYLTIIQLVQFTLGVSLGLNSIITNCPFTRWMQYVFVAYAFSFLVLFGNFYRLTYINRKSSKRSHHHHHHHHQNQPEVKPAHKPPNNRDLASFFSSLSSGSNSGSGSDNGSSGSTTTGKKSGRHSKQSKLSMLNAKHNYGQMGRRKKVKSG